MKQIWKVLLIFIIVTVIIFGGVLTHGFALDDEAQLVTNQLVQSLSHLPKLLLGSTFYAWTEDKLEGLYYKPLMMTAYSVIYALVGLNPFFYHTFSLLIHVINGFLVYRLLVPYLDKKKSILAGLLFLVHPINVEVVAYIACYQDLLFTLFGLLALLMLRASRFKFTFLMLTLSLLSKETGILYVIYSLIWIKLYRPHELKKMSLRLGLLVVGYALLRTKAIGSPRTFSIIPIASASFLERLMTLPKIVWFYISTFFFPLKLSFSHHWVVRQLDMMNFWLPLGGVIVTVIGLYRWVGKKLSKEVIFFGSWLILGVGLHGNLFPLDSTVVDRWFYTPIIGVIALLLIKVKRINFVWGAILLLLAARSMMRVADWKDTMTLASHDYLVNGSDFMIDDVLGLQYVERQEYDKAIYHLELSTQAAPGWGMSWNNLGVAYENTNQLEKAMEAYINSIKNQGSLSPVVNLGRIIVKYPLKTSGEVRAFFDYYLKKYPQEPDLWYLKSKFELDQGNKQDALEAAEIMIKIDPSERAINWLKKIKSE